MVGSAGALCEQYHTPLISRCGKATTGNTFMVPADCVNCSHRAGIVTLIDYNLKIPLCPLE